MIENPYEFYLSNSLQMPYRDEYGTPYIDLLRRAVLESEFQADTGSIPVGQQLYDLYLRSENYRAAEEIAAALFSSSGETTWLVKQLRCLLLMGEFEISASLYEAHQRISAKPIVTGWDAIQFMRDLIFNDDFLNMEETDYAELFFLKPLTQRLGPHLRFLTHSLMDRFFIDLMVFSKHHVERCGASFQYVSCSNLFGVANKSKNEMNLAMSITRATKDRRKLKWLQSNPAHMAEIHKSLPQYTGDYIAQLNPGLKNMVHSAKLMICDWESEFFNIRDGQRVTVGQPEEYDHVVHCVGESETFGYGTEDALTFSSVLQGLLNLEGAGKTYRVENYGFPGGALPFSLNNLLQKKISEGDVVVFFGFPEIDAALADRTGVQSSHISFSRPHDYGEVFVDDNHFGWTGHKVVAEALYDRILNQNVQGVSKAPDPASLEVARSCIKFVKYLLFRRTHFAVEASTMKAYLDYLNQERVDIMGSIGSVAVNCDPMTNGHLHLLEHAARKCDFLYVFVIEESGRQFDFDTRMELVVNGLAHLDNVKVLKGGRYICTDVTVPEYSAKNEDNDAIADMSMEAWSFGEYIAKTLNITRIFLGREPLCAVTKQYNDQMEIILPKFGIGVEIIDRIEHEGDVISASRVRAYLDDKRFDLIGDIVPPATYKYLIGREESLDRNH